MVIKELSKEKQKPKAVDKLPDKTPPEAVLAVKKKSLEKQEQKVVHQGTNEIFMAMKQAQEAVDNPTLPSL